LLYTTASTGTTTRYWYELDGHNNVVALTDSTGNVVDRYSYDLWGKPTISLEGVPQPFLYAGYVYDRELTGPGETTGWYWLSVRSYDPALGRFLQPDPSEIEGSRSYVYAGDDPLDATDPSGLAGVPACMMQQNCPWSKQPAAQGLYDLASIGEGGLDVGTVRGIRLANGSGLISATLMLSPLMRGASLCLTGPTQQRTAP